MRLRPATTFTALLACMSMFAVGCEQKYSSSFKLMPGSVAQITAEGDRAFAVIRNRGPSALVATFGGPGIVPVVHEVPGNADLGESMKHRSLTLLGGAGESSVELEVQNASGFSMNLAPNELPVGPASKAAPQREAKPATK